MSFIARLFGLCFLCDMELVDMLWVSGTVNVCTLVFFAVRGMLSRLLAVWRENADDRSVWRSVIDINEDQPWRLPRFCVDLGQSTVLTIVGFIILCREGVLSHPFTGPFSDLTATGFALAIGCYLYRIGQDTVLYAHLKNYRVDLVHHLVAVAVYSVFLTYRQNALFGAIGLICTGNIPSIEVSRLLKALGDTSGKPTALRASYHRNLVIGATITVIVRVLLPVILGSFAIATSTPLVMAVPVVAFFFTSLMFFGAINLWLLISSLLAVYRLKTRDVSACSLDAEDGRTLPTKSAHEAAILAKQNVIHKISPCANINVASTNSLNLTKVSNNNSTVLNNYAKMSVNEALILPLTQTDRDGRCQDTSQSSGQFRMLRVGDDGENARPRAVRFLVPVATASGDPSGRVGGSEDSSVMDRGLLASTPCTHPQQRVVSPMVSSVNPSTHAEQQRAVATSQSAVMTSSPSTAVATSSSSTDVPAVTSVATQFTTIESSALTASPEQPQRYASTTSVDAPTLPTHQENPLTDMRRECGEESKMGRPLALRPVHASLSNLAPSVCANAPKKEKRIMRRGSLPATEMGMQSFSYLATRSKSLSTVEDSRRRSLSLTDSSMS